jgi:hypothetical protein
VYLLLERGDAPADPLLAVEGVAGIWSAATLDVDARLASAPVGQTVTYCFLDEDPLATAERLGPVLTSRWDQGGVEPLLAAPFYPVVPHEWDRYVP